MLGWDHMGRSTQESNRPLAGTGNHGGDLVLAELHTPAGPPHLLWASCGTWGDPANIPGPCSP